jgi:BirA family biotin operon repressor/biotin-[acetyl-CoA-carboxylase] ligase
VAHTRFDDGEVLSVLALWRPYTGSPIHSVDTTESTNDDVLAFSSKPGASVRAEQQTKGRGRHGRRWLNQEGAMLASWLVEDGRSWVHSTMDQLRVGEALVRLLKGWSACGENEVCLKWPNDVYIRAANGGMAKAGGVLFEAVSQGRKHRLVLGIGVNSRPSSSGEFSGLADLGLEVDAVALHSAVHAMVASLFESLIGLTPSRIDSVRIEASVKHGLSALGVPLYRGEELVIDGLDEAGALIVKGSERTIDDPELLTWSIL